MLHKAIFADAQTFSARLPFRSLDFLLVVKSKTKLRSKPIDEIISKTKSILEQNKNVMEICRHQRVFCEYHVLKIDTPQKSENLRLIGTSSSDSADTLNTDGSVKLQNDGIEKLTK